jgi:hypothetical protein
MVLPSVGMAFNCNVVCGSTEAEPPMQLTKELDLLIHLIAKLHFLMQLTGEMGLPMQLIAELDLPMVMIIEPSGIMQILMVQFLTLILMTYIYRSNNEQNQIVDVW